MINNDQTTKIPADWKNTEMGAIPNDWECVSLGSIGVFSKGKGITKNQTASGIIPCVRYGELYTQHENIVRSYHSFISPEVAESSVAIKAGDILFAGSGETREDIGRCAAFIGEDKAYAGGDIVILRPTNASSIFLGYLLNAPIVSSQKSQKGQGDAVVHINSSALASINIPLPSVTEQRVIAGVLSEVDELLGSLERLLAKKRDLKQAAMQELLTGHTRLPGFGGEWDKTTLGEIGHCIIGLTYKPDNVTEHGLLVLRSANIQNGRMSYDDNVYVNIGVREHLYTRLGDILVCVRNGSRSLIGKCSLIDEHAAGFTFGAFMSIYRTPHWKFVHHAFQSDSIQQQIRDNIGATINQITNKDMKALRLKLPSKDEQSAIATVLSDMDTEIEALETRIAKTKNIKLGMMQELLTGRTRLI